jgi:hypothetical protein
MANDRSRTPAALRLVQHAPDDREAVSQFIRNRFFADYGARLTHLMPQLFSLRGADGQIAAAFGLREAATARLYMESYLDQPVEQRISTLAGRAVARDAIIEVGNLAAQPGGARAMIAMLTSHLYAAGFEWVTFTGVVRLRAAFHRLGLQPIELARATPDRLSAEDRVAWGRYFDGKPVVMAGNVAQGHQALVRATARTRPACSCDSDLGLSAP